MRCGGGPRGPAALRLDFGARVRSAIAAVNDPLHGRLPPRRAGRAGSGAGSPYGCCADQQARFAAASLSVPKPCEKTCELRFSNQRIVPE
jgi:hypothetical protein